MDDELGPVAASAFFAAACKALESTDYARVSPSATDRVTGPWSATFEDASSVVGVQAYESIDELIQGWPTAQSHLTDLISRFIEPSDPKAWDGYLVLIAPERVNEDQLDEIVAIQYNTSRVRKLVVTGDKIAIDQSLRIALSPLLPLSGVRRLPLRNSDDDFYADVERLIEDDGIEPELTRLLLVAYRNNEPLMSAIESHLVSAENGTDVPT